ncbi:MAG: phage head closure protein [Hyphomicrobiaceae bacterium]|nr:phage head closure protein [Hyphomicrobiaceae bacterium]
MKAPRIGALRQRLRLEAPLRIAGDDGGATVTWQLVATPWAEVVSLSGREVALADGLATLAMHEVRIRHRPDVTPEMRFVIGERVLDIRAVRDLDGRCRWLSCLCEEKAP